MLVAASLLFHLGVLVVVGLGATRPLRTPPLPEIIVLPLLLEPSERRRDRAARPSLPADADAGVAARGGPSPGRPAPQRPDLPASVAPAAGGAGVEAVQIDDPWRVRGRLGPPPRIPCPPAPGDRLGQRLCLVGPAPMDDRTPETYADVGPRRGDRSEQARDDGFERQTRANEAWRDYTRGEGAYPGLRSLFRDR